MTASAVELDIWNNPLYVSYDLGSDGVITEVCKDADGQEIQTTEVDQENHILALNDERFANVQIQPNSDIHRHPYPFLKNPIQCRL